MTKIYYFSGTGNSLWSAKKIAQGIIAADPDEKCEMFNIGAEAQKDGIIIEADAVIMVYPSYAFGLPLVVSQFVKRAVFKTQYIAAFVTYGSKPLGTQGALMRLLRKKGINKMFFGGIPAVENYLAIFGPPKAEKKALRSNLQKEATEKAVRLVIERQENKVNTFNPFSVYVSWLFSIGVKIFYRKYRIAGSCNGCALCEKICPVSAIVMTDNRPHFTNKCEHCQGCVNMCPLRAIQFGRVKFGSPGYRHHDIEIAELMRNN